MAEFALRLENGTDTAARVRRGDGLSLQHDGPTGARTGLRPDGGGAVAVLDGTMSVTVAPFSAWIDGGVSVAQGGYPFILDAAKTLAVADGDATLERVDTVAAVVYDDASDGSGQTVAEVVVVQGVPGAGAPALPATAVPLRDVTVPAGLSAGTGGLSSANLGTDRRVWTVAAGGVLRVSGAAERDALPKVPGQVVHRADTGRLETWGGVEWSRVAVTPDIPRIAGGRVTVSIPSGTNPQVGSLAVTFPAPFPAPPAVSVTAQGANPQNTAVAFDNVTVNGFTLYLARLAGGFSNAGAAWIATEV
jgi:hypothetical protein